jgi:hypothetical protein
MPGTIATSAGKTKVGYKCPPTHSQFKPGVSGNPSGRPKGGQNLKTLFNKILNEEVALREGSEVKKISKAEAILRSVVVGALRGDTRSLAMLLRLAEHAGGFEDKQDIQKIERIVVTWKAPDDPDDNEDKKLA